MRQSQQKSSDFSTAEKFKKPLWQTMWTQIILLFKEQSDLGSPCLLLYFVSNARQLFAADDFSRCHFSDAFFLGALRINGPQGSVFQEYVLVATANFVLCRVGRNSRHK